MYCVCFLPLRHFLSYLIMNIVYHSNRKKEILLKEIKSAVSVLSWLWLKYLMLWKNLNISAVNVGFNYKRLYTFWNVKTISKNFYSDCHCLHTVIVYTCACGRRQQRQTLWRSWNNTDGETVQCVMCLMGFKAQRKGVKPR